VNGFEIVPICHRNARYSFSGDFHCTVARGAMRWVTMIELLDQKAGLPHCGLSPARVTDDNGVLPAVQMLLHERKPF
jgi:hypothetical protein